MVGPEYKWLLAPQQSAAGAPSRLVRSALITAAVAAIALGAVLGPRLAQLSTTTALAAPTAVALQEPAPQELPVILVRLWILAPQLLSQRR